MSNTADYNRWGRPGWAGDHRSFFERPWHPAWIVLTVLGFIVWWPVGLALLFFTLGSRRMMGCGYGRHGRWEDRAARFQDKMERMQGKMERFRSRMEHTFAEKVLSAMRHKFGGHLERPTGG